MKKYETFVLGQRWVLEKWNDEFMFFETCYTFNGEKLKRIVSIPHRGRLSLNKKKLIRREKAIEYILRKETERILREKINEYFDPEDYRMKYEKLKSELSTVEDFIEKTLTKLSTIELLVDKKKFNTNDIELLRSSIIEVLERDEDE